MDYAPAWSPEGERILFFSWRGGTRDLWWVPSAGGEPLRIESGPGIDQYAAWSHDGATIAYTAQAPGTNNDEILLLPAGGSPKTLVAHPAEDYHPAWSPDSRWIAFTSHRLGSPDVWIVGTSGGDSARLLIGGPAVDGYASWSPGGERVLFQSSRSGTMSIWSAPYRDGACGEPAPLVAGDGTFTQPRWSPSGDLVACVRMDGGRRRLVVVDAAVGAPAAPRPIPLPDSISVYCPDWSPDGRSIAFTVYADGGSRIWIVTDRDGFGPYQERDAPRRK
jgi:TolB protein